MSGGAAARRCRRPSCRIRPARLRPAPRRAAHPQDPGSDCALRLFLQWLAQPPTPRAECTIGAVRGRPVGLLVLLIAFPSAAIARPVLVLGSHGHAVVRNDPFLTVVPGLPPAPAGMRSPPAAAQASRTVSSE